MKRFPFSFLATFIAVVASSWMIIASSADPWMSTEIPMRITMAAWFFALVSITIEVSRYAINVKKSIMWVLEVCALALSAGWFILLGPNHNDFYVAYIFVMFAVWFVAFFFVMSHPDRQKTCAHFVKSVVLAFAISGIIVAGLLICVSAVHGLLFKIPHFEEVLAIIAVFGFGFVGVNTVLALLPEKDEEIVVPKVMKTLCFYVAFPLFIALVVVLFLYLGKVLITQKIPSNQINLYVSLVSLVFIFFSFVLTAFKGCVIELFEKYMGYVVLPLIAMQVYVVGIRLNAYGYTPLRWASVVCIFLSVCFAISTFIKGGKFKRYIILVAALCMLLLAYGPLSVLNVPARSQVNRMQTMLEQNNMWKDGRIVARADAPGRLKSDIISSYKVIVGGSSVPAWLPQPGENAIRHRELLGFPYWGDEELEKNFKEAFGFSFTYDAYFGPAYSLKVYHEWKEISVQPFEKLYIISQQGARIEDKSSSEKKDISVITYGSKKVDMKPYIHAIKNPEDPAQLRIQLDDGAVLFIKSIMYEEGEQGEVDFFEFDGYVLTQ